MNHHCTLYLRTLELLRTSNIPLLLIYKETDLPFYWLRKLYDGKIENPSVNRIQQLYEYLTGKPLEL